MASGDRSRGRFAFRPLLTLGWLVVLAGAFVSGYLLAGYDADKALGRIQALQTERDALTEALAAQRDAHARLERMHLMDREAARAAQTELADLQGERLRLAKQVAYLRGLMHEAGTGVVEVKEFALTDSGEPGVYLYRFTVKQLVPEFGRSRATATLRLLGRRGDDRVALPLSELDGSSSGRHQLDFEHFQACEGTIKVPPTLLPQQLVVEIQPVDDNLTTSSDAFAWQVRDPRGGVLPLAAPADGEVAD